MTSKYILLLLPIVTLIIFSTVIPADAIKSSGNSNTQTNSKNICGNQICDEPLSTQEKIERYLERLSSKLGERSFEQGRFQIGGVSMQAHSASTCQTIDNPSPTHLDYFGEAIAANDNKIAISSPGEDVNANNDGVVYIFDTNNCNLLLTIQNPDPDDDEFFGGDLALLGNDKLIVGNPLENSQGKEVGEAYVFDINSGNLLFTLANPAPEQEDQFGRDVGTFGNDILVGVQGEDISGLGLQNVGTVFLFDGNNGNQIGSFGPPQPHSGDMLRGPFAEYGNKVLIGAPFAEVNVFAGEGAVFIYDPYGTGGVQPITGPTPESQDRFGFELTIINDLLVVGEPTDKSTPWQNQMGKAHTYNLNTKQLEVTIDNPEAGLGWFSRTMIGYDPECVAIATPDHDRGVSGGDMDGTVYIFNAKTGDYITKIQPQSANSALTSSGIHFGHSLATTSSDLLVGAPYDFVSDQRDGRVFLYELPPCILEEGGGTTPTGGGSTAQYVDLQWVPNSFVLADSNLNPITPAEQRKQFYVIMDITNTGNIPASPFDFLVQLMDTSNNKVKYYQHHTYNNILAAGQTDTVSIPITMQITGSFEGSFSADSNAAISEIDELNNREFFWIDIIPPQTIPLPSISLDKSQYFENDQAFVDVIDGTKSGSVTVNAYGSSTQNHFTLTLAETGTGTGIFSETINRVGDIAVSGEKLIVEYGTTMTSADVVSLPPPDIAFDKPDYDPSETVTVNAISHYDNTANQFDTISVRIHSSSNPTGMIINPQETGPNTAIFSEKFSIPSWTVNDGSMTVTFTDSAGNTVSATATITQNRPVSIDLDKSNYLIGDSAKVTIIDDAANQNPTFAEKISYNAWSSTNPTPIIFDAIETSVDSGEFVQFWLVSGIAKNGDTIFVKYSTESDSAIISQTSPTTLDITSVNLVDTQGNVITKVNKGTIANIKVELQNPSVIDVYLQISLQDSSLQPIGASSITMQLPSGTSEFTLSTVIPMWATSGQGEIISNVLSAPPSQGGYPLVPSKTINFTIN